MTLKWYIYFFDLEPIADYEYIKGFLFENQTVWKLMNAFIIKSSCLMVLKLLQDTFISLPGFIH